MSTKLDKSVTRQVSFEYEGRSVLVTLEPGDTLSFKPLGLGEGQRSRVSLEEAYKLARGELGEPRRRRCRSVSPPPEPSREGELSFKDAVMAHALDTIRQSLDSGELPIGISEANRKSLSTALFAWATTIEMAPYVEERRADNTRSRSNEESRRRRSKPQ